jgi:anti-sigma regulatory factor (Ser/Thr protein kinase)
MEMIEHYLPLPEASAVGEARRRAVVLAQRAGLDETASGRVALIATEAASNAVKHGGGGECLLRATAAPAQVEIVVIDRGPGIASYSRAARDGYSSAGTAGTGLGAIARLATTHDLYSRPGQGTVLYAVVAAAPPPADRPLLGTVAVPYPGEPLSGDAWAAEHENGRSTVLVVDGLGHGQQAHAAARTAIAAFAVRRREAPVTVLEDLHMALKPTRGAAVAVTEIDRRRGLLRFAGLGNVAATVVSAGRTRSLVSMHGTAGHDVRRFQEFTAPWQPDDLLVLHSDGIGTRWTLDAYPGVLQRHPMLIAAVLYRDFRRGRDDATVLAMRDDR